MALACSGSAEPNFSKRSTEGAAATFGRASASACTSVAYGVVLLLWQRRVNAGPGWSYSRHGCGCPSPGGGRGPVRRQDRAPGRLRAALHHGVALRQREARSGTAPPPAACRFVLRPRGRARGPRGAAGVSPTLAGADLLTSESQGNDPSGVCGSAGSQLTVRRVSRAWSARQGGTAVRLCSRGQTQSLSGSGGMFCRRACRHPGPNSMPRQAWLVPSS